MPNDYFHIIEYNQRGPLWKLMDGVTCYENHHVLETKGDFVELKQYSTKGIFVIHTSGKNFPMISSLHYFLEKKNHCVVFIHTLPDYIVEKGFSDFIPFIAEAQDKYKCKVLVPSSAAKQMFGELGVQCKVVNLGIPAIDLTEHSEGLEKYFNKIITVSTKKTDKYMRAKGIDCFCQLMHAIGMESQALILGIDAEQSTGIESIRLPHQDFLYVLSHARAYIQLSRSESYNITAVEAKQLRIPILVSNSTGHKDSVKNIECRTNDLNDAVRKLLEILNGGPIIKAQIQENYEYSIRTESIETFRNRIESAIEE